LTGAKEKLPFIRHVTFDDDAFFAYGEAEIEEFCREYKRKIGLPLDIGGATPTTLTRGKLSLLVNAGLTGIRMGIQTASERTKKLYKRRHSNELVEKSVNIINEFKDKIKDIRYDIIINNPWETREDLVSTLMFLARFPTPYRLNNFNLTFFPETELYKKARKDGLITDDIKEVYSKSYSKHEQTYLNDLFHLLSNYSNKGIRITPGMISLLTDKESLKSRLLYAALKAGSHLWKILDTLRIILVSLQKWDRTRFDRWYEYKFFINR
ncbi:MAG: radical SAM protein, partial [bacterium]